MTMTEPITNVNRREVLKGSLATAATASLQPAQSASPAPAGGGAIVDTHVYVSRWPIRRLKGDETPELVAMLRKRGVTEAWAGSFDALLHKDLAGVNSRLAAECGAHGQNFLVPFGAIDIKLPDWEEDLRRCHEQFRMPGIRLHPNYHNYTLKDPAFERLLRLAAERSLIVQIAAWMEDERTQHPFLRVPVVDLDPLPALLEKVPSAKVVVLNGFMHTSTAVRLLSRFRQSGRVAFDIAMLENLLGVKSLIEAVGVEGVVFGSYAPMFIFESAALKLNEAALAESEEKLILERNARRFLASAARPPQ